MMYVLRISKKLIDAVVLFVFKIWSYAGVVCQDWSFLRRDALNFDNYDACASAEATLSILCYRKTRRTL